MADGTRRAFVARQDECWRQLRPAFVADVTSANIRGNLPPREVPPGDWPNAQALTASSAEVGAEVLVEDWDAPEFPTLRLRMTSAGWVVVSQEAI